MKINTKLFNSISRVAAVLMVLCIIPSGAFASENKPAFAPAENITDENYADVQADLLDSLSEQIAELQSFYTNVSEASDASELQEVLASQKPANGGGHDGMNMGPGGMDQGPGGMPGLFGFAQVENVTDDNYTDVQASMVDFLGNMTEMLNGQLDNTTDENMTGMLNEQITELETLSTDISAASSAEELQNVVFTYMQTQAVDSLEMEIEHLEARVSESENTTDDNMTENLSSRITELTARIDDINGAESLEDLMGIMSSSRGMPGMGVGGPMQHGGCGCPMPPAEADNSTDDSTDDSTE
jgi:hypothetical protein